MNCATCRQPPLPKQQECFLPLTIPSNSMFCVPSIKSDCAWCQSHIASQEMHGGTSWSWLVCLWWGYCAHNVRTSTKHQLQLKSVTWPTSTAQIKTVKMLENVLAGLLDLSVSMHVPTVIARIRVTANRKDLLTFSYTRWTEKKSPYDFCWYYSNAWKFLYEILHDC